MDLTKWKEKMRIKTPEGLRAKFAEPLKAFQAGPGKAWGLLTGKASSLAGRNLGRRMARHQEHHSARYPAEKRRPMLFILGGGALLFLVLIITVLALHSGGAKKNVPVNLAAGPSIPADDLFIPTEPDFLPKFLLEREPRRSWSLEDIRPYWKSPENPALWRGEIKSAVDKLMEAVP